MPNDTQGPSGTPKEMATKPKKDDQKNKSEGAEKEIHGVREDKKGKVWYRRVGGDSGQIGHTTTGKNKRTTPFLVQVPQRRKRSKKGAVQAAVPGKERGRVEERNAVKAC